MVSLVKRFGAVSGIISIKTHLKGAFGFNGFLELAFFHWRYLTWCTKRVWIYPKFNILPKFSVSTSINELVDLFPNIWCNNPKATFFLGAIFFDFEIFFIYPKMHVSAVHYMVEWHDVQKGSWYIPSSTSFQTFVVSPSINDLVNLCPNPWCNKSKETFFLGAT